VYKRQERFGKACSMGQGWCFYRQMLAKSEEPHKIESVSFSGRHQHARGGSIIMVIMIIIYLMREK